MKKKILVADDDFSFRSLLAEVLGDEGYNVSIAEDGIAALKILQGEEFDILITDIGMPKMNGIELFNNVKELYPQMPIIFITGYSFTNAATQGLREDHFYYFEKPVDLNFLQCTIKHILKIKEFETKINSVQRWLKKNIHNMS